MLDIEGGRYEVFRLQKADLASLDLIWRDASGAPLGGFGGLVRELHSLNRQIVFATNAGIFERGPTPCGLQIRDGKEEVPLNLRDGEGNFYLKPNGVFLIDAKGAAAVLEAVEYATAAKAGLQPRIATQSGPLLLRKGRIHPVFNPASKNLRQRSGIGVRAADGAVIFIMSDREDSQKGRVTFHQLARAFLAQGCQDALYLDGDISQTLRDPDMAAFPRQNTNTFGAMFVATKPNAP